MEQQPPTVSGANFYGGNGQNHNSSTILRKGHSHTHGANPSTKSKILTRNHPPLAAGNFSRENITEVAKYAGYNPLRYDNRDTMSNEVRQRLNPMSNPDTMEHTKEYLGAKLAYQ